MRYFMLAFAAFAGVSMSAEAQSQTSSSPAISLQPFEGTWRIDTSQDEFGGRPVSRLIKDGVYRCGNCVTTVEVPADGRFHSFAGGQDFDEVAVSIRSPREVEFQYRKSGKLAETVTEQVSPDGTILTYRNVNLTAPTGQPIVSEGRRARVGAIPAGAHMVSGEWQPLGGAEESAEALTIIIQTSGDEVTIVQPTGRQFTARIGGPAMPIVGDQAGRRIRIVAVPPGSLLTTTSIEARDVQTALFTVAPDGRSLTVEAHDLILNQDVTFVAIKQ